MNGQIKSPVIAGAFHNDANTGVFFERALDFIKSKAYQTIYAPNKAMDLLPVSFEVPEGAKTISYELFDEVGIMKLMASSGDDLPRIDSAAQEFTSPSNTRGGSFVYTIDDIAAAQMAGVPLSQKKANATVRAFRRAVNQIAWQGNTATGLPGLLNNPNIITGTVPTGTGGVPWNVKTNLEILKDMNIATAAIINASFEEFPPDTMLLPVEQFAYIAGQPMSVDNSKTILEFFLNSNPWIKTVDSLPELDAANNAVFATDAMVVYSKNPDYLTLEIPKMIQFQPVQFKNFDFLIPAHSRIGGVIIYQPLSIAIYDGI